MCVGAKDYSEETAREVDLTVRQLIDEAYKQATTILAEHLSDLKAGAALLLDKETITPADFAPISRQPEGNA